MSFVFAATIGIFSSMSVLGVQAEGAGTEPEVVDRGTLLYETDMVTRKDFEEGFQNYAKSDAIVDFAADGNVYSVSKPANVVGAVKDYETEEMIPGATIFTFYISDDFAVHKDREEFLHGNAGEQQELTAEETDGEDDMALASAMAMTEPPAVNSQIRVFYNGNVHTVDREQYIYTVLSSEVCKASWYEDRGLTAAQRLELYVAQAIAANTYSYVCSQFFSGCNDEGTKTNTNGPALQGVSCTDIDKGYIYNHRHGMCQMGAAKRARDLNEKAAEIISYYYTDIVIAPCPLK